MHFSNGRFSNKETGFSGPFVVWSLLGAPGEKKRENQMYLQGIQIRSQRGELESGAKLAFRNA